MSSQSPALGEALLALPDPWAGEPAAGESRAADGVAKAPRGAATLVPDDIDERLSQAHFHAREQALAGEEIFRVIVGLQDSVVKDLLPSAMSSFTRALHSSPPAGRAAEPSAPDAAQAPAEADSDAACLIALHAQAASLVEADDIGGAIAVLCALMDWPSARGDALLGLAICAVRVERYDAALALALDYLKGGGRHPRAHCIVGLCHLRGGDKRAAQNHLAIAARAARADPTFRDELRAAQRLLIILNFGR